MKDLKLKASYVRTTRTGFLYEISSFSRDPKTAQAEMDFFHENYTELSTTGSREEGMFYSEELFPKRFGHATLTYDENTKSGKWYWNLNAPETLLEEAAISKFTNRSNRRAVSDEAPVRRSAVIENDPDLD